MKHTRRTEAEFIDIQPCECKKSAWSLLVKQMQAINYSYTLPEKFVQRFEPVVQHER